MFSRFPEMLLRHRMIMQCDVKKHIAYLQKSGGTMPNTLMEPHSSVARLMVNQPVLSHDLEPFLLDGRTTPFAANAIDFGGNVTHLIQRFEFPLFYRTVS